MSSLGVSLLFFCTVGYGAFFVIFCRGKRRVSSFVLLKVVFFVSFSRVF